MGGLDSIVERLRIHYLKGYAALCEIAADNYARELEGETLSIRRKWELKAEVDLALRDRDTIRLMIDLLERKRKEEAENPVE